MPAALFPCVEETAYLMLRQGDEVRRNGYCVSKSILIEGATGISRRAGRQLASLPRRQRVGDLGAFAGSRVKPLAADLMRTCARMGQLLTSGTPPG